MAERLALAQVATCAVAPRTVVAYRSGAPVERERFVADVAAWRAAFAAVIGKHIAFYFDDGYEFACALYGAWHAGKEVSLLADAQEATLQRWLPHADACAGDLPGAVRRGVALHAAALQPLDARATRLTVYTSGSSGEPVAIPKTLLQLDAEMRTLNSAFGAQLDRCGTAVVYTTVSHQHIYGLLFCILWPLAAGRPFEAERLSYPEQMAARLGGQPSVLVSSPAHLKRLPETLDWQGARAGLQAIFSSGGPLPAPAAQASLALLGRSPIEVLGSSETGGIAWRQREPHGERWTAFDEVEWRIDDELLCVRSPHLPDGAWYLTADRVRGLEPAGFVLLGRADRIVKIEEKRISLSALERRLEACCELTQARVVVLEADTAPHLGVVAVPSASGMALYAQSGKRAFNEHLRLALLHGVERVALPRRFRYVAALPVNAQGKTTEAALTALFRPRMPVAQWLLREPERAALELSISPDLAVFDGHFAHNPILPGVAQLDWAVEFARQCFALPDCFVAAQSLKFVRPVLPGACLRLALQWRAAQRMLTFVYSTEAGTHASADLVFDHHVDTSC